MRISTKGQVTIPQDVRERLGLLPGSEVEFEVTGETATIIPVKNSRTRGDMIVEHLRRHGKCIRMTTDEIMALTRGD